jgi:hypothetical protein
MAISSRKTKKARSGGLGNVAAAAARQGKGKAQWVTIDNGEVVQMRLLDTGKDFKDGYVHRVAMEGDQGTVHVDVMCLDQKDKGVPCPGCKDELDRRYKFWANVIVRDHENESGDEEDTLMVWSGGINVAKQLDKMAARRSLLNRDIEVEREGLKLKTTYSVDWAQDEDVPLTDEDEKLAENKVDLSRYTTIPEYDDFYTPPWERNRDDDDDDDRPKKSGFARRKKTDEDDDDDEPKQRSSARRRPSSTSKAKRGFTPRKQNSDDDEPSRKKSTTARRPRPRR